MSVLPWTLIVNAEANLHLSMSTNYHPPLTIVVLQNNIPSRKLHIPKQKLHTVEGGEGGGGEVIASTS